jgi:hypothetical protein
MRRTTGGVTKQLARVFHREERGTITGMIGDVVSLDPYDRFQPMGFVFKHSASGLDFAT